MYHFKLRQKCFSVMFKVSCLSIFWKCLLTFSVLDKGELNPRMHPQTLVESASTALPSLLQGTVKLAHVSSELSFHFHIKYCLLEVEEGRLGRSAWLVFNLISTTDILLHTHTQTYPVFHSSLYFVPEFHLATFTIFYLSSSSSVSLFQKHLFLFSSLPTSPPSLSSPSPPPSCSYSDVTLHIPPFQTLPRAPLVVFFFQNIIYGMLN